MCSNKNVSFPFFPYRKKMKNYYGLDWGFFGNKNKIDCSTSHKVTVKRLRSDGVPMPVKIFFFKKKTLLVIFFIQLRKSQPNNRIEKLIFLPVKLSVDFQYFSRVGLQCLEINLILLFFHSKVFDFNHVPIHCNKQTG